MSKHLLDLTLILQERKEVDQDCINIKHNIKTQTMKFPKRGVQLQGVSQDDQCATLIGKIKLEEKKKASAGDDAQLLGSAIQPPQDALVQCLKDKLKCKLLKVKSMNHSK